MLEATKNLHSSTFVRARVWAAELRHHISNPRKLTFLIILDLQCNDWRISLGWGR